jgi:hypothetical protein
MPEKGVTMELANKAPKEKGCGPGYHKDRMIILLFTRPKNCYISLYIERATPLKKLWPS